MKILKAVLTTIKEKFRLLNPKVREAIQKRKVICTECPFNSVKAVEKGLYETDRIDFHCSKCGCVIDLYVRCLSCTCSIKEYNEQHGTNLPVRWLPI